MSFIALIPPIYYNVLQYGADASGVNDSTTAIAAAITAAANAAGGTVFIPSGTFKVSTPLNLNTSGVRVLGTGLGSIIQPTSTFSGAQIFNITANNCGVQNLQIAYANTTYSSNPVANGIEITGATGTSLRNLLLLYINGYIVESLATAGQANYNTDMSDIRGFQCKAGFHMKGVTGSNYNGVHRLYNCYSSLTQNGDCIFIEDCDDIEAVNIFSECSAGSGSAIHVKGACNGVFFSNVDIGYYPGPTSGSTVLIESSANGSPNYVTIQGGIIEGSITGVAISAGNLITIADCHIYNCGTYGMNFTGGDAILVRDCTFEYNGSSGTTGRYDFQSSASGHVTVQGCYFYTAQGTTTQKTNNAVNVTAGTVIFRNNAFYGTGYNAGNIFASTPTVVQDCPGYNPLGKLTAPTIGASPYTVNVGATDITAYITGGTVSQISIAGQATGLTSGAFHIKAGQTIGITYTVAPSWQWFGD